MNVVIKSFCCFQRLFDPINPDKDTIQTRVWTRQERLDKEYLVLQRLEDILEKANFSELPPSMVNKALEEHSIGDGIKVNEKIQPVTLNLFAKTKKSQVFHVIVKYLYLEGCVSSVLNGSLEQGIGKPCSNTS